MSETLIASNFFDDIAWVLNSAASFEESNRSSISSLKDLSIYLRDPLVGGIVLVLTTVYLIRGRLDRIAIFFSSMMSKYPLPAARRLRVADTHIQNTRELLFFYTVLLCYQIAQYPFTSAAKSSSGYWPDVAFWADLTIQAFLVGAVAASYKTLKEQFLRTHDGEESEVGAKEWLEFKLEGLQIRLRDIRRMALGLFAGNFTPPILQYLPNALSDVSWLARWLAVQIQT